jgi:hypothetical protein
MRAEAWRKKNAPSRDIVTVIESAVPCAMGGETGHRLRFAIDGGGHLKELAAGCPDDPILLDGVGRLGGFLCCQTLEKYKEYLLGLKHEDRWGEPAEHLEVPTVLKPILKKVRDDIITLRNKREDERKSGNPVIPARVIPGDSFKAARIERIRSSIPRIETVLRAVSGISMHLVFRENHQPVYLTDRAMDYRDPHDAWLLRVGNQEIGYRNWGKRGWHFDEVAIRKNAIPHLREAVFIDEQLGAINHRRHEANTYCITCKGRWRNQRSHAKSTRHGDKVMHRFYKAMKAFPGPKQSE